jgi:hypothetical protein
MNREIKIYGNTIKITAYFLTKSIVRKGEISYMLKHAIDQPRT